MALIPSPECVHSHSMRLAGAGGVYCMDCDNAELGQFPYQVSLQQSSHYCGGSVLSANFVSTAAHCRKTEFTATAGTIDNKEVNSIISKDDCTSLGTKNCR